MGSRLGIRVFADDGTSTDHSWDSEYHRTVRIGRRHGDQLQLKTKGRTRIKARIALSEHGPKIVDLGSEGGVSVNGTIAREAGLALHDTIVVGGVRMVVIDCYGERVENEAPPQPEPSPAVQPARTDPERLAALWQQIQTLDARSLGAVEALVGSLGGSDAMAPVVAAPPPEPVAARAPAPVVAPEPVTPTTTQPETSSPWDDERPTDPWSSDIPAPQAVASISLPDGPVSLPDSPVSLPDGPAPGMPPPGNGKRRYDTTALIQRVHGPWWLKYAYGVLAVGALGAIGYYVAQAEPPAPVAPPTAVSPPAEAQPDGSAEPKPETEIKAEPASPAEAEPSPDHYTHTLKSETTLRELADVLWPQTDGLETLRDANPGLDADNTLAAGSTLNVPRTAKHTVGIGDSLGAIAKRYLGDPTLYTAVFEANRDTLADPSAVEVGMELTIPLLPQSVLARLEK